MSKEGLTRLAVGSEKMFRKRKLLRRLKQKNYQH